MGYKASIIRYTEKHWYWFMWFQLCSVHLILCPVWGQKPLQPEYVLCNRTSACSHLLLLRRQVCLLSEIFLELCFLFILSAFHNHFIALWHARTNFMACSVVVEYLLFPSMAVKQAGNPAWCLAHPTVCFIALDGFSSLWNLLTCTSLMWALFVLCLHIP